jgi:hypothetical protein
VIMMVASEPATFLAMVKVRRKSVRRQDKKFIGAPEGFFKVLNPFFETLDHYLGVLQFLADQVEFRKVPEGADDGRRDAVVPPEHRRRDQKLSAAGIPDDAAPGLEILDHLEVYRPGHPTVLNHVLGMAAHHLLAVDPRNPLEGLIGHNVESLVIGDVHPVMDRLDEGPGDAEGFLRKSCVHEQCCFLK